jgi:hypothetical protein
VVTLCLGLLLSANCGGGSSGGGSGLAISNQVLSGKIGGQPWTFAAGESDAFLSTASTYYVDMYPSSFTACATFAAPTDVNLLIVDLPTTTGSFNLSLARNATFYVAPSDNWVATRGRIQIDEVTATTITGGANMTYNADNTVDGQFQITICP